MKAGSHYMLEPSVQNYVLSGSARDHHRDRPSLSQQGPSITARREEAPDLFVASQSKNLASRSRR